MITRMYSTLGLSCWSGSSLWLHPPLASDGGGRGGVVFELELDGEAQACHIDR